MLGPEKRLRRTPDKSQSHPIKTSNTKKVLPVLVLRALLCLRPSASSRRRCLWTNTNLSRRGQHLRTTLGDGLWKRLALLRRQLSLRSGPLLHRRLGKRKEAWGTSWLHDDGGGRVSTMGISSWGSEEDVLWLLYEHHGGKRMKRGEERMRRGEKKARKAGRDIIIEMDGGEQVKTRRLAAVGIFLLSRAHPAPLFVRLCLGWRVCYFHF